MAALYLLTQLKTPFFSGYPRIRAVVVIKHCYRFIKGHFVFMRISFKMKKAAISIIKAVPVTRIRIMPAGRLSG
jgi:hypothetical protein